MGGATDAADSVIGLGVHSGLAGTGGVGVGGDGGEGGGAMAPFGPPGGGMGIGLQAPFIGISGNAKRVVYICDASGSMLDKFDVLQNELRKSVDVLNPIQSFNIIFFRDVDVTAIVQGCRADHGKSPVNKRKAFEASLKTCPLPAKQRSYYRLL